MVGSCGCLEIPVTPVMPQLTKTVHSAVAPAVGSAIPLSKPASRVSPPALTEAAKKCGGAPGSESARLVMPWP